MQNDPNNQSKKKHDNLRLFILLTVLSLLLIVFSTHGISITAREFGRSIFSGLRNGLSSTTSFFTKAIGSIKELSDLRKEYQLLTEKMLYSEILERDVAQVRQENLRLKQLLGFLDEINYVSVPAKIIGKDPNNLFSSFVLNKGAIDGIRRDMPVVAHQDGIQGLLGKIIEVSRSESILMPIFDLSSNISVRLQNSRYEGILYGQGDIERPLLVKHIKKSARANIDFGDIVVTSGLGGIFPSELYIGRVTNIISRDFDVSLEIELQSPLDITRIEYVFIIGSEKAGDA